MLTILATGIGHKQLVHNPRLVIVLSGTVLHGGFKVYDLVPSHLHFLATFCTFLFLYFSNFPSQLVIRLFWFIDYGSHL